MFTVIRKSVKMALKNKNIAKGQKLDIPPWKSNPCRGKRLAFNN